MNADFSTLSDSELLAGFKKCSPKTGDRLVMYAEIKKRGLLGEIDKKPLLFRSLNKSSSIENLCFIASAVIFGNLLRIYAPSPLNIIIIYFLILLILFSALNFVFYSVIFIYSDHISVSSCLFTDRSQIRKKTIKFCEQGLYITIFCIKPMLPILSPITATIVLRTVPRLMHTIICGLTVEKINNLLAQLDIFLESIKQDIFIETNSQKINITQMKVTTDFKSFCQKQWVYADRISFTDSDINWQRLIAMLCAKTIPLEMQNFPLTMPLLSFEDGEQIILHFPQFTLFKKNGYVFRLFAILSG